MTGFKRTTSKPVILTPDIQAVRKYAAKHPDKFIQSQLQVVSKQAGVVPFKYSWTQNRIAQIIAEEEAAGRPLRLYILKSRQIGTSTFFAYRFFTKVWAQDNIEALILAQFEERSEELVSRLKFAYASMPDGLKLPLSLDSRSGMQFADTRGKLTIASARNIGIARGGTKQLLLLTEFAMYKEQKEVLVEFSEPIVYSPGTEIIIETTGQGYGSEAHHLWEESRAKHTVLRAEFLRWQDDPDCTFHFTSDKDRDNRLAEAFDYEPRLKDRMRHYGLTAGNVYYAYQILKNVLYGDYQKFIIDHPCDEHEPWTSNQLSFFGTENCNKLRVGTSEFAFQYRVFHEGTPLDEELADLDCWDSLALVDKIDENGNRPFFKVWTYPKRGHEYVVSSDSSDGLEAGDFSSCFVIDMNTFEMMAEFHGKVRPDELGYIVAFLGNTYMQALAAPEINPPGNVTFMTLQGCYSNIYRYKHPYMDNILTSKNATRHLAWQTNSTSRPTMLALGKRLVEDLANERLRLPGIIKSRELVNEMSVFCDPGTGKPEAIHGACDDRVMAWAIAVEVARQEIHGTDKDILALYKMQKDEKDNPLPTMDVAKSQRDPAEVIASMREMWATVGPKLWIDEDYKHHG